MDDVNSSQSTEVAQAAPISQPVVDSSPSEKMLRQSEVNEIVGRAKADAIESYKRQNLQQQSHAQPQNHAPIARDSSGNMDEASFRRLASEEAQRLRDEWVSEAQTKAEADAAQRIVKNFWEKIEAGKSKYADYDEVAGDVELSRFPHVVQLLADHIDNAGDVMYELGKDRLKMSQLESLSRESPRDAITHVKRLAQSIKNNEDAANVRHARAPLSQQRPSNLTTDSGAVLSVRDYRNRYKV